MSYFLVTVYLEDLKCSHWSQGYLGLGFRYTFLEDTIQPTRPLALFVLSSWKYSSHLMPMRLKHEKSLQSKNGGGVPTVAQQVKNLTSTRDGMGSITGLTQWVKDPALPQAVL